MGATRIRDEEREAGRRMLELTPKLIAEAVRGALPELACVLSPDVVDALRHARECESGQRACLVLDQLLENARIAERDRVPICQDTGSVWACLEIGPDVVVHGDVFSELDEAVAQVFDAAKLRKSIVRDALFDRGNTQTNAPAFREVRFVDEPGVARLHLMLKGGGSDNASRVVMLAPGEGREAIVRELVKCVREKAANACPPLVIGVGVGATFDKVAGLAKHALMREIGAPAQSPEHAAFEAELLDAVNATGLGPGALGGETLALAVHLETAPCHIAAMPLAINLGCCATRRISLQLLEGNSGGSKLQPVSGNEVSFSHITRAFGSAACDDVDAVAEAGASSKRAPAAGYASADAQTEAGAGGFAAAKRLELPLSQEDAQALRAGDFCLLSGPMYTLRDAGHMRLLEELEAGDCLPYDLDGHCIFYAGPTPPLAGRPFGAIGPTTAGRMDFAAPTLYRRGIKATLGKGVRSEEVRRACEETDGVYFVTTGGAAALLANCVKSAETIAYDDLGTEALRRIEVADLPVFVGIDGRGAVLYDEIERDES